MEKEQMLIFVMMALSFVLLILVVLWLSKRVGWI